MPQTVDEGAHSRAPREAVWALVADPLGWTDWGPWSRAEVLREGVPPPGGLHAVKRLKTYTATVVEEVTLFDPPARLHYEMRSGLPLRGYRAEISLDEADGGGTDIRWATQFEPKLPGAGALYRSILSRFTAGAVERLARAAERG